jgi:catalase
MDFLRDQYRHGKPMLMLGGASALLQQAGIPSSLPDGGKDEALIMAEASGADAAFEQFTTALAGYRQARRDVNAPKV